MHLKYQITPEVWGKYLWKSIHIVALAYPAQPTISDMKNYKSFFHIIGSILPCKKCSIQYMKHLKEIPIETFLNDTDDLFEWTVKIHNIVNKSLGKKEWTLDEAIAYYSSGAFNENTCNHCDKPNNINTKNVKCYFNNNIMQLLFFITFIIILLLLCIFTFKSS